MIWGYHYFRKHPYVDVSLQDILWCLPFCTPAYSIVWIRRRKGHRYLQDTSELCCGLYIRDSSGSYTKQLWSLSCIHGRTKRRCHVKSQWFLCILLVIYPLPATLATYYAPLHIAFLTTCYSYYCLYSFILLYLPLSFLLGASESFYILRLRVAITTYLWYNIHYLLYLLHNVDH